MEMDLKLGMEMDLQKAFDTVSHPIRLHKPYHYGILGPSIFVTRELPLLSPSVCLFE